MSDKEITADEESAIDSLGEDLQNATPVNNSPLEVADEPVKKTRKKKVTVSPEQEKVDEPITEESLDEEPELTDPTWSDYVMRQFVDDELDGEGRPYVPGLRRVARKLLGPILRSAGRIVQAPSFVSPEGSRLQPAVAEYTVEFLWTKLENGESVPYRVEFTDAADVYAGNTDAEYCRHATATACTKAEARCYRKALLLKNIIAAEESTEVPVEEAGVDGKIIPTQINFIDRICQRLKIDAWAYINSGNRKYDTVEEIPYERAAKMAAHLSTLQDNPDKISEEIKGYKKDWQHR